MYIGKNVLHLPTVKTHGHSTTTGAIKNAFGGLLKEVRHYAHKYIHEVLVDLLYMQKEIHPGLFCVMDGTVCGDGAGPRTMVPWSRISSSPRGDSVAIDAIAARMMGFDPMSIPYHPDGPRARPGRWRPPRRSRSSATTSPVSTSASRTKRSLVIWGDQMIRKGFLRCFEGPLLHSPLVVWAPLASNIYHDWFWYPTIGRSRIRKFMKTEWGALWKTY